MNHSLEQGKAIIFKMIQNNTVDTNLLKTIVGGRNNRAYHAKIDGNEWFVKHYNQVTDANCSRLSTEYTFLNYAALCKCRYVSRPIAFDVSANIGIYEFIQGRRFSEKELTESHINDALSFIKEINTLRQSSAAADLPNAAEACFSLAAHILQIDKRIERLQKIDPIDSVDLDAQTFVQNKLISAWQQIKKNILDKAAYLKIDPSRMLTKTEQIVSPSDFGFHNALKMEHNNIKFVDFEYAGWDDPAKMICDFFNQIQIPVPSTYLPWFTESVAALVINKQELLQRVELLFPLYKIKWVCITLNYFLPAAKKVKEFVTSVSIDDKKQQLVKAKKIIETLSITTI